MLPSKGCAGTLSQLHGCQGCWKWWICSRPVGTSVTLAPVGNAPVQVRSLLSFLELSDRPPVARYRGSV